MDFAILCAMPKKNSSNKVTIGLAQMTCEAAPALNLEKALARIGEAAAQGAQIVCLQELFRSRYFCQSEDIERFKLAEAVPGPTSGAPRAAGCAGIRRSDES